MEQEDDLHNATVKFSGIKSMVKFVDDVNTIKGEVNFRVGKFTISAKSLMNIFTLDLRNDIVVVYAGDDFIKFFEVMDKYK